MRCHTSHLLLAVWAMVVFSGVRVAHCLPLNTTGDLAEPRVGPALFSSQWAMEFGAQGAGCRSARGNYMWRIDGFGSNVNSEYGSHAESGCAYVILKDIRLYGYSVLSGLIRGRSHMITNSNPRYYRVRCVHYTIAQSFNFTPTRRQKILPSRTYFRGRNGP